MQLSTFISNAIILALAWTATAGPIEKRSPLILTLHRDLLVKNLKLKSFSAILKLPKEADDEKIVKFAHVGWQWVQKQGGATASEKAPGAMVALQSRLEPEKLWMASSIKGGAGKYWTQLERLRENKDATSLLGVLDACESATDAEHRTGAACAEPNVLDLIMAAHPEWDSFADLLKYVHQAKFVPIVNGRVEPPCSGGPNNCKVLVQTLQMTLIPGGTLKEDDEKDLGDFTIEENPRETDESAE